MLKVYFLQVLLNRADENERRFCSYESELWKCSFLFSASSSVFKCHEYFYDVIFVFLLASGFKSHSQVQLAVSRQQTQKWLLDFDWLLTSNDYLILTFDWFISAG